MYPPSLYELRKGYFYKTQFNHNFTVMVFLRVKIKNALLIGARLFFIDFFDG